MHILQVAVALMERMAIAPGQDPAAAAQSFAKDLHDAWGVGDAQCNNGVLLLLSIGDRQVHHRLAVRLHAAAGEARFIRLGGHRQLTSSPLPASGVHLDGCGRPEPAAQRQGGGHPVTDAAAAARSRV
jgi:Modulator of levamisole receptor-1